MFAVARVQGQRRKRERKERVNRRRNSVCVSTNPQLGTRRLIGFDRSPQSTCRQNPKIQIRKKPVGVLAVGRSGRLFTLLQ